MNWSLSTFSLSSSSFFVVYLFSFPYECVVEFQSESISGNELCKISSVLKKFRAGFQKVTKIVNTRK
jgi:hypothetical protein